MNEKINKILRFIILITAFGYILSFLGIACLRSTYPFELEWMEGGSVEQVDRILQGKEIYTKPSIEFIPHIYTPLYYYVSAGASKIFGLGLFPLRLVSIISTLVCMFMIYVIVKKETESHYFGIISSGMFAATFGISGAWFDLARVDMLFMMFYILSLYYLFKGHKYTDFIIAGVLAGLAFLTKQQAIIIFAPVCFYLFIRKRNFSWYFNITFASMVVISVLYYSFTTDGWFYFWNFTLPAAHKWNKNFLVLFWTNDLFKPLGLALIITILFFYLLKLKLLNDKYFFYLSVIIGAIMSSWLSRLHYGGYFNVLIPIYTIISIIFGIGVFYLFNSLKENNINTKFFILFVNLMILFQFLGLTYTPYKNIPGQEELNIGLNLVKNIKSYKGDVYIPGAIYFARYAGKKVYTHGMLIRDLIESSDKYGKEIESEIVNHLKNQRFDAIITYTQLLRDMPFLERYYQKISKVSPNDDVFWMKSGYTTRPEYIYLPKKNNILINN